MNRRTLLEVKIFQKYGTKKNFIEAIKISSSTLNKVLNSENVRATTLMKVLSALDISSWEAQELFSNTKPKEAN